MNNLDQIYKNITTIKLINKKNQYQVNIHK